VHDGIAAMGAQDLENLLPVADFADEERGIEHRLAEPSGEIVQDHDLLAASTELQYHVAADVTGASGD